MPQLSRVGVLTAGRDKNPQSSLLKSHSCCDGTGGVDQGLSSQLYLSPPSVSEVSQVGRYLGQGRLHSDSSATQVMSTGHMLA